MPVARRTSEKSAVFLRSAAAIRRRASDVSTVDSTPYLPLWFCFLLVCVCVRVVRAFAEWMSPALTRPVHHQLRHSDFRAGRLPSRLPLRVEQGLAPYSKPAATISGHVSAHVRLVADHGSIRATLCRRE